MPPRNRRTAIALLLGLVVAGAAPGCGDEAPRVLRGQGGKQRLKNREDDEVRRTKTRARHP